MQHWREENQTTSKGVEAERPVRGGVWYIARHHMMQLERGQPESGVRSIDKLPLWYERLGLIVTEAS